MKEKNYQLWCVYYGSPKLQVNDNQVLGLKIVKMCREENTEHYMSPIKIMSREEIHLFLIVKDPNSLIFKIWSLKTLTEKHISFFCKNIMSFPNSRFPLIQNLLHYGIPYFVPQAHNTQKYYYCPTQSYNTKQNQTRSSLSDYFLLHVANFFSCHFYLLLSLINTFLFCVLLYIIYPFKKFARLGFLQNQRQFQLLLI